MYFWNVSTHSASAAAAVGHIAAGRLEERGPRLPFAEKRRRVDPNLAADLDDARHATVPDQFICSVTGHLESLSELLCCHECLMVRFSLQQCLRVAVI
ncbi:MAG: hypothetical protein P8Y21_12475 [Gemmatimonadales bacterium]